MSERDLLAELKAPFPPSDVEWRIQQAGKSASGNPWVMVIPYITNRAIQQRLDDVFGLEWQNLQKPTPDGTGWLCGISVKVGGEWITRWDGSEKTHIEPLKGGLSGAMKRAGVQFGIGRYLYQMDEEFAKCRAVSSRRECQFDNYQWVKPGKNDKWSPFGLDWETPGLPSWALPTADVEPFREPLRAATNMDELKSAYLIAYRFAQTSGDKAMQKDFEILKDEAKERIQQDITLNIEEYFENVSSWLDGQINAFSLVPNLSSVAQLHKAVKADLDKRCKGQLFDIDSLQNRLAKALDDRQKQLENKKA